MKAGKQEYKRSVHDTLIALADHIRDDADDLSEYIAAETGACQDWSLTFTYGSCDEPSRIAININKMNLAIEDARYGSKKGSQ